jgi:hypothetical protein
VTRTTVNLDAQGDRDPFGVRLVGAWRTRMTFEPCLEVLAEALGRRRRAALALERFVDRALGIALEGEG